MIPYIIFLKHKLLLRLYSIFFKGYFFLLKVKHGKNLKILMPLNIIKHKSAEIIIGDNVTLNSDKKYYHLNMFSSVKLIADKPNAIISIGDGSRINGACIHAFNKVELGRNCLIAANTQIADSNGHLLSMENPTDRIRNQDEGKPIFIKDNVWIGTGCVILGGTIIGKGAVIAANSVIKGNIPAKSIYGGNPAKLIKQY